MKLFDSTVTLLEKSLDARLERHNILAANLANQDTPGYVPKDLDFQATLTKSMSPPEMNLAETSGGSTMTSGGLTTGGGFTGGTGGGFMPIDGPTVSGAGPIDLSTSTTVRADHSTAPGIDGNKVDGDKAMVNLAENAMQYGASARAVGTKLAILKYVANDGTG